MSLIVALIFFVSGAAALVFETVWFRLAGLAFGNSVWASSLVLASFMGGLALGNVLVARFGRELRRPLLTYAVLECAIAVFGFGLVLVLPTLTPVLAELFRPFTATPWALNGARLLSAFVLLLIPTTAMGATLPLLVRTLLARSSGFGSTLGLLYGFNTLGAFVGALSGEIFFLEVLGVRGTGLAAAGLSGVAALSAALLGTRHGGRWEREEATSWKPRFTRRATLGLITAFLAGGLLLALEVVWFRFLLLFVWGTSTAFAVMLAVVLLGIAVGGLAGAAWLARRPDAHRMAPILALVAGSVTAGTYFLFRDGFGVFEAHEMVGVRSFASTFVLTLGLTFPTSFLSGVLFPLIGRALEQEIRQETVATAALTVANTLGAMVGSLLAGFVLIPSLGMEASFFAVSLCYAVVAAAAAACVLERVGPHLRELSFASAPLALVLVFFPFGLMENFYLPVITEQYRHGGEQILAVREGRTETAIYLRGLRWGEPFSHRLVTNGHSMSGLDPPSKRYMSLFAQWPLALKPDARRALLISYGIGTTAKTLTEFRGLESIDVVDISRAIVDLSLELRLFPEAQPLEDPRVRVHIEDGRFFLQSTNETFDVITGEPPPPKNAGVVNLYTREYFQILHQRLAPGGLATYWLPAYQLVPDESRAIARAFCDVFADCTLWTGLATEWMLAGSKGYRGRLIDEAFQAPWRTPSTRERLISIGVERPEQMGALFIADSTTLDEWIGDVAPLVDNYPLRLDAVDTPDAQEKAEYAALMDSAVAARRFDESEWIRRHWPAGVRERTGPYFRFQGFLNRNLAGEPVDVSLVYEVLSSSELSSLPLMLIGTSRDEIQSIERAVARGESGPHADFLLAMNALTKRDYDRARSLLARAIESDPRSGELRQFQILAMVLAGDHRAVAEATEALRSDPSIPMDPRFLEWLGDVFDTTSSH